MSSSDKNMVETEYSLKRRLDYEHAIVECMRILLEPKSIDDTLLRILDIVHRVADTSRTYIFKNELDPKLGLCMSLSYEAVSYGIDPQIDNPNYHHLSYKETASTLFPILEARQHFAALVEDISEPGRTILSEQGIRSILIIPIFTGQEFWGFIGYEDSIKARKWDEDDIILLKIVADGIGKFVSHMKAEDELRKSESLLSEVGTIAKIGGWEYDVATGAVKWTPEVYKIFDIDPDFELAYGNTLGFYSSDSRKSVEKAFNNAIEKGEPYDLELELITPKGNPKWVKTNGRPTMENGKMVRITGSFQDITEHKTTENKLFESEEKLSLFIEHAPASLAMFDRDMRYIAVSRRWKNDFSLVDRDIIGISHYETFPEITDELKAVHQRAMEGEVVRNREDRFERADGTIQWLYWEVRPWKTPDGTIGGIVIFSEDITEQKKAEHSLIEAKMLAEHNNRIKSEFLANMSHELRTPLTAVIGFSDILRDGTAGELKEKQLEYVNHINKSGKHLLEIINDILDLSKIEAGKMELDCEEFNVSELTDVTLKSMTLISGKKNIKVNLMNNINNGIIFADEVKFQQILYNLLSNAIKFTPDNGEVLVSIERTNNGVQVSVADTGIGIPAEMQEDIFSPFTQADASSKRRYGGTGLGLALVKRFVEMHNGKVWLESEEGKGSVFTFTIENQKKDD